MSTSEANESRPTWVRYRVLIFLLLAATIAYVGRNCLSVVVAQGGISSSAMGRVMSAFFWGYALAQIPSGWLAQKWGVRSTLALYAIIWSVACAAIGTIQGFWELIALQVLFGVAQAGVFPCCAAAISQWLPPTRRAFASGTLGSFMSIGGAIGAALTGFLIADQTWNLELGGSQLSITSPQISWRWVFPLYALPGLVWGLAFFAWYRNHPAEHRGVNAEELRVIHSSGKVSAPQSHERVPWGAVVRSLDMWMICGQQFFRAAGYVFLATWFPTFLKESRGVSTAESGFLTAMPLMGVVAGGIVGGLLVDWLWNRTGSRRLSRQVVAIIAMLGCACGLAAAYFVEGAVAAVTLITAGMFSAALAGSCGYTVTIDKAGRHVAPVFGVMNMSGNLGAALCPTLVEGIKDRFADPQVGWNAVLVFFAGIYISAAVCWALLNPNGTLEESSSEDK